MRYLSGAIYNAELGSKIQVNILFKSIIYTIYFRYNKVIWFVLHTYRIELRDQLPVRKDVEKIWMYTVSIYCSI